MTFLPYRAIFVGDKFAVTIAGPFFQILSVSSGARQAQVKTCDGIIMAADVAWAHARLVTTGDDKMLNVYHLQESDDGIEGVLESSREIPKKSAEVHLTSNGETILASDKFGDVYTYPLISTVIEKPTAALPKGKEAAVAVRPAHGELILGHTSVITSFVLTPKDDFVITGDRDEHIRVSWFPQGYNIECFCMGHRKYVSALHVPSFSETTLLSGGGDPDIFIWNWTNGKLLHKVPIMELARPLMKVKGGRRSFIRLPRRPDGQGLSRKSKRRKGGKAAAGKQEAPDDEAEVGDDKEMQGEEEVTEADQKPDPKVGSAAASLLHKFDPSKESFVVGQIGSLKAQDANLVLFTVVGASGLFYFGSPDASEDMDVTPSVQVVNLELPVLHFEVRDCDVWVSVDATWQSETLLEVEVPALSFVKLVSWTGEMLQVAPLDGAPKLLQGFNAATIEAPEGGITSLELYSSLAWLPKSQEEEADDSGQAPEGEDVAGSAPPEDGDTLTLNQKQNSVKKLEGRMRRREKQAQYQAGQDKSKEPHVGGASQPSHVKKPRLDDDDE